METKQECKHSDLNRHDNSQQQQQQQKAKKKKDSVFANLFQDLNRPSSNFDFQSLDNPVCSRVCVCVSVFS